MKFKPISRRTLLRGAGGISIGLPFLEAMRPRKALAQTGGRPKRFVVFYHPQGTVPNQFLPQGSETSFNFPRLLAPCDPYKEKMVVLHGVGNRAAELLPSGNNHERTPNTLLTGGNYGSGGPGQSLSDRISVDQAIAEHLHSGQRFRSVDLNVSTRSDRRRPQVQTGLYHRGANDPVTSIADPRIAMDRLFAGLSGGGGDGGAAARLRARRLSVLDAVKDNFQHLRGRLGQEDRVRLDAHAEKIRELETSLNNMGPVQSATCEPINSLNLPGNYDIYWDDNITSPIQIDLLTMALACDLTTTGTVTFDNGHEPQFRWMRPGGRPVVDPARYDVWHTMVHTGRQEENLVIGFEFYSEQFAYLLQRLSTLQDEDGPLIDSTMVLWTSDFFDGGLHDYNVLISVLAGNTGGPTGRWINHRGNAETWDPPTYEMNQLCVSMMRAFGMNVDHFGRGELRSGPVPGLV